MDKRSWSECLSAVLRFFCQVCPTPGGGDGGGLGILEAWIDPSKIRDKMRVTLNMLTLVLDDLLGIH